MSSSGAAPRLRGYVTQEELVELYRGAACLVMPSRYEGFGLPVLEAMASGTPVVAAPDAALREVAGEAAVFVEPERLAEGMRQALADRERLVAAGLERARQLHLGGDRAPHGRRLPGGARGVRVAAVVVTHGHRAELAESLPALVPQVDEVVVIANTPGSAPAERSARA